MRMKKALCYVTLSLLLSLSVLGKATNTQIAEHGDFAILLKDSLLYPGPVASADYLAPLPQNTVVACLNLSVQSDSSKYVMVTPYDPYKTHGQVGISGYVAQNSLQYLSVESVSAYFAGDPDFMNFSSSTAIISAEIDGTQGIAVLVKDSLLQAGPSPDAYLREEMTEGESVIVRLTSIMSDDGEYVYVSNADDSNRGFLHYTSIAYIEYQ